MHNTITLDFATDTRTVTAEANAYAAYFGCTANVVVFRGRTGWPVVEFTGGWTELDALLADYHRGSDSEEDVRWRSSP